MRLTKNKTRAKIAGFSLLSLMVLWFSAATVSAATANTTISSAISAVISLLTTNGAVNVNVVPTGSGAQTIASDTVTVSTNDSNGYTLSMADSTTNTNLVSGGNDIPASSGTQSSPVTQAADTWGYCIATMSNCPTGAASSQAISGSDKFAGVPSSSSPNTLADTSTTATNATTTVWYAAAADTNQPSGTYTTTVTYTAVTN